MEEYEAAKLRMQCLELAERAAIATASGFYSVVSDANKYWNFVKGEKEQTPAAVKSGDEIPF
jgi:hypothetical protein